MMSIRYMVGGAQKVVILYLANMGRMSAASNPPCDLVLVDENDEPVAPGENGEICIRADKGHMLPGLFNSNGIHGRHSLFRMIFPLMVFGSSSLRVYVLSAFQGRGYGSLIMEKLEREAARQYAAVRLEASLPACLVLANWGEIRSTPAASRSEALSLVRK